MSKKRKRECVLVLLAWVWKFRFSHRFSSEHPGVLLLLPLRNQRLYSFFWIRFIPSKQKYFTQTKPGVLCKNEIKKALFTSVVYANRWRLACQSAFSLVWCTNRHITIDLILKYSMAKIAYVVLNSRCFRIFFNIAQISFHINVIKLVNFRNILSH